METFLGLIFIIACVGIWLFWKKKPNKKLRLIAIAVVIIDAFIIGFAFPTIDDNTNSTMTTQRGSGKSSTVRTSSHKKKNSSSDSSKSIKKKNDIQLIRKKVLANAKKLRYGMTLNQVKRVMGSNYLKEDKDEKGYPTLSYLNDTVLLCFDKKRNLIQSLAGAEQVNTQREKAVVAKKKAKKDYENRLVSFAQSFGSKPFETIQKMPSVYKIIQTKDNELQVEWKPEGLPLLIRVDNTTSNITKVYEYNKKVSNGLGRLLYTGRTILQKDKRPNVYY